MPTKVKKSKTAAQRFVKRVSSLRQIYTQPKIAVSLNTLQINHTHTSLFAQAKQLHARVYLARNFIDAADLAEDGTMHLHADPHQTHADYFVVVDENDPGKVLGTARQIKAVNSHDDFPVLVQARLSKRSRKNILQVSPEHCIEISGLAKEKGVPTEAMLELYRSMWLYSREHNHKLWLMACDVRLYKRLKILFGSSIHRIGKQTHYKGGDIIPCVLDLSKSSIRLNKNLNSKHPVYGSIRRKVARNFLHERPAKP